MVAGIGADKPLEYNLDMNFVIVPKDFPRVPVKILDYPAESDPGPFPIPDDAPIENWPLLKNENTAALPRPGRRLARFQREAKGDRHLILVDPGNGKLHEFWQAHRTDEGWAASNAATFDLRTGALRPERWTSGDAAGLPIFPAVVRYDECARGHGRARHAFHRAQDPPRATSSPPPTGRAHTSTRPCRAWASASGCGRTSTSRAFRRTCRPS